MIDDAIEIYSNSKTVIFYSLISGDVYELPEDEIGNLDEFQIPLLRRPNSNCKTCYGRGYIGFDRTKKYYPMCRCIMRYVDKERVAGNVGIKY